MSQLTTNYPNRITTSISNPEVIRLLVKYKQQLNLDYVDTIRLALKGKLPAL